MRWEKERECLQSFLNNLENFVQFYRNLCVYNCFQQNLEVDPFEMIIWKLDPIEEAIDLSLRRQANECPKPLMIWLILWLELLSNLWGLTNITHCCKKRTWLAYTLLYIIDYMHIHVIHMDLQNSDKLSNANFTR